MNILEISNISKTFGKVKALRDVSLDIVQGETLALVGQNGAGKSTLVKILTGAYQKDQGQISFDGSEVQINCPADAQRLGIAQVYQQAELIPEFTVAENMLIGNPGYASGGMVNARYVEKAAQALLDQYDIPLNAKQKVSSLSGALKQLVAIAKVLYGQPKIIIWDEPTAVLSNREVDILFDIIKKLKQKNITMIYISHRLEEIFEICERVAVMRDGELVKVLENKALTKEIIIGHMLGHSLDTFYAEKAYAPTEEIILEVNGISTDKIKDISFKLRKGEILGVAGLVNSGRTETLRAIYGLDRLKSGEMLIDGKPVSIRNTTDASSYGMFLAPEDRKREALVLCRSIKENVALSNLRAISHLGLCKPRIESKVINDYCRQLNVKMSGVEETASNLSGGNQQKVVIAKAVMAEPKILLFDEPTQGIDVGARAEIYALLQYLRGQGLSMIIVSSEIEEIQMVCDRTIVLHDGRMTGTLCGEELYDTKLILDYMYRSVT